MINRLLDFKLEDTILHSLEKHKDKFILLSIIFLINIGIYGQRLFFQSLATDDYARFFTGGVEQASHSGRWMAGILNQYIFTGPVHILPYLNGLLGVISIVIAGFLTAIFFKRKSTFEILAITLIISTTPFFAHNLYFNTNISAWVTLTMGVIGLYLAYFPNKWYKIFGFLLLVVAFGTYQNTMQVVMIMVLIRAIIDISEPENQNNITKHLFYASSFILFIAIAFIVSSMINHLYLEYIGMTAVDRMVSAFSVQDISVYIKRILSFGSGLQYFNGLYKFFIVSMTLFGLIAIFILLKKRTKSIVISILLTLLFILSAFIIIQLPALTGANIHARSHFTISWLLAGFLVFQMLTFIGIFKTISNTITILLIITNIYYINTFFYASSRQTDLDLTRVNQIVNRIRLDENYIKEPMQFEIIGINSFSVAGWYRKGNDPFKQTALATRWDNYEIFKYFTDFNFKRMTDKEYNKFLDRIKSKNIKINAYPGKNSILVNQNQVVLFLNTEDSSLSPN